MKINKKAELLLKYAEKIPAKNTNDITNSLFIEIGCVRNPIEDEDGHSTKHLARFCQDNFITFISYDTNPISVNIANQVLIDNQLNPCVFLGDGAAKIKQLNKEISFLYLDSHRNPFFTLEQYKAAKLTKNSVLIIDDCQSIDNFQYGKAEFVKQIFDKYNRPYKIIETIKGYATFVAIIKNGKQYNEL